MTTDDSLEHIFDANTHNAVQQSVALQLRQRQSSRFDEEAEYLEELRDTLSKARLELGSLRAQVTAFELERANWRTTAITGAALTLALRKILSRIVGKEEATRLEQEEAQAYLNDAKRTGNLDKWSRVLGNAPWRL